MEDKSSWGSLLIRSLIKLLIKGGCVCVAILIITLVSSIVDEFTMPPKIEKLSGTWVTEIDSEIEWYDVFEHYDFYEEEIQIIKNSRQDNYGDILGYDVCYFEEVKFLSDKTYSFRLNTERTKEKVVETLLATFTTLFDHKEELSSVYDVEFSGLTQDEFQYIYALFYGYETFDEFIDDISNSITESLAEGYTNEDGTYKISGNKIKCIKTGDDQEEVLPYKIDDVGNLHLDYVMEDSQIQISLTYNRVLDE